MFKQTKRIFRFLTENDEEKVTNAQFYHELSWVECTF